MLTSVDRIETAAKQVAEKKGGKPPDEKVFFEPGGAGDEDGVADPHLRVRNGVMQANYTVVGQNMMSVVDADAEVAAARTTIDEYAARDAASFTGGVSKEIYIQHVTDTMLKPAQAALAAAEARLAASKESLKQLRSETGRVAGALANQSAAKYAAAFHAAADPYPEVMAELRQKVQALSATMPPAKDADGNKTCKQLVPADAVPPSDLSIDPAAIVHLQEVGLANANTFYVAAMGAFEKEGIAKGDLKGSSVAEQKKGEDRLMEKALQRHGGDPACITDFGRVRHGPFLSCLFVLPFIMLGISWGPGVSRLLILASLVSFSVSVLHFPQCVCHHHSNLGNVRWRYGARHAQDLHRAFRKGVRQRRRLLDCANH